MFTIPSNMSLALNPFSHSNISLYHVLFLTYSFWLSVCVCVTCSFSTIWTLSVTLILSNMFLYLLYLRYFSLLTPRNLVLSINLSSWLSPCWLLPSMPLFNLFSHSSSLIFLNPFLKLTLYLNFLHNLI